MSDFGRLRRFITFPRRGAAGIRRDVSEELQLHIDMRAAALVRSGLSPEAARAQALREFGDLDNATRYCTDMDRQAERRRRTSDWLSELHQDGAHALRILRRAPAFTAATMLTLAVALGASTAVYGVLHTYLMRPLPYPESDRLVFIQDAPASGSTRGPSLDDVDWTTATALFDATASWNLDGFTIPGEEYAERVTGAWVTPGFFQTLGLRPALGRGFLPEEYRESAPVVILSHDLWVRRFAADSSVIGRTINTHSVEEGNAATTVTIVGVTPRDFWPIHWRESELLRPLPAGPNTMPILARLTRASARADTEQRLNAIVRAQLGGDVDPAWRMRLVPALERHSAPVRPLLFAVFGAALFMLLAACGSVAGALASRMSARRSELAVRLSLGGSRARIVRQLLTESAVLGIVAGVLGLAIAYVLLDASGALIERQLGTKVPGGAGALRPGLSILLQSGIVSTLAGVVLGLIPALSFLRFERSPATFTLLATGRSSAGRAGVARVRRFLIAGQVAVAMVLLFGAGLMFRTLARIADTDLGFRADGLVAATLSLPEARYADSTARRLVMTRVLERVAATEGVTSAAAAFTHPFWPAGRFPVLAEGSALAAESAPRAGVYTVSPGYFETMEIPLRAGRVFRAADDHAAPLVAVISQRLARQLDGDVVGRRIRVRVPYSATWEDQDAMPWRTVVGVVGDTRKTFASAQPDAPDVYVPYAQNPRSWQAIVVRTARPESSMFEPIKRAVGSVDPGLAPSGVESVENLAAQELGQRSGLLVLLGAFATFALVLSALALYASLSYTVLQRRSELAVRRAVGASASSIMRLVVGEGLLTAVLGVAVGAVASLALSRILANQLFGIGTSDPITLVAIALVLALTALAACAIPGLRATRTDPAIALRD